MRMLGPNATVAMFRWDLIYLAAELLSDDRAGVGDLAAPVQAMLVKVGEERAAYELAEDQVVVASALLHKKDRRRDALLIKAGGVARATDKEVYASLFSKMSPSSI